MPKIHPSLIVRMAIDDREFCEALELDIKRNFNYVATTFVEPVVVESDMLQSTLQMDVVLHRQYWAAEAEGADQLWKGDLAEWLNNAIYKVSNNVTARNKTAKKHDQPSIDFDWTEFRFGENMTFAFKTRENGATDKSVVATMVQARQMILSGELGQGIAKVRIPSMESFLEQAEAAKAAEAARAAAEAGAKDAEIAEAWAEAAEIDATAAPEVESDATVEEEPEEAAPKHVNFNADTTIWGIEYADGTTKQFDTQAGAFVTVEE